MHFLIEVLSSLAISFYLIFFFLTFIFSLKNWKIRVFLCRRDKGSFLYDIHREGKEGCVGGGGVEGSQDFRQFCECLRMVLGESGFTLLNVHMDM